MLGKPYAEPPGSDATVDVGGQAPSRAFLVNLFKERLAERILFDNDVLCREVKFNYNTERLGTTPVEYVGLCPTNIRFFVQYTSLR